MNNTVLSMSMQVFILDANTDSFGYILRSSIVELYFRFQGISKLISIVAELIYILPRIYEVFLFPTSSLTQAASFALDNSHSDWGEMGFNMVML